MRLTGFIFALGTGFFALVATVYWLVSHEPVGTVALAVSVGFAALISFYLYFTHHRLGDGPEDLRDAEISDRAGQYGEFSPHSWWPLPLAASGAMIFLGVIIGTWLMAIGVACLAFSVIGLVFEHYRGAHAH